MTRYDETGFEPLPNVSIDDFDAVTEPHEFSATYQARKAALLGEYRAQCMTEARREVAANARTARSHAAVRPKRKHSFRWKFAVAAAAAALVVLPAAGFAVANNADFFANAFGTGARESVTAHEENVTQGDKTYTVTLPAREYVDVDSEEAEHILGDYMMTTPVEIMAGEHKITVLSAVRDVHSAVIHYTVSREGGVTALEYDALSNERKGALISNDSPYYWLFYSQNGTDEPEYAGNHIFVNAARTTNDSVDCYDYISFLSPTDKDTTIGLMVGDMMNALDEEDVLTPIPFKDPLPSLDFANADGARVSVPPLSVHVEDGLSVTCDYASDGTPTSDLPSYIKTAVVAFDDGSTYLVMDNDGNVDNTAAALGGPKNDWYTLVFNRLVNPDAITSITINGIEFTR